MSKRSKGEGTVFWNKRDQRWQGQVTTDLGTKKTRSGKTQSEVVQKLNKVKEKERQGLSTNDRLKLTIT